MKKIFTILSILTAFLASTSLYAQYSVTFKWTTPDAVRVIIGSTSGELVDLPAGATSYVFEGSGSVYVAPAEGYVITGAVKSTSDDGKSESVSGNFEYGQVCGFYVGSSIDGAEISVSTAKLDLSQTLSIDVANGADCLKCYTKSVWNDSDGVRFEYYMPFKLNDGDNKVKYDPKYTKDLIVEVASGAITKSIFSVVADGKEINGGYNKNSFLISGVSPATEISIRVFENDAPVVEPVVLTVEIPENMEGCIYSIRNWTTDTFVELKDGKLDLIKGTDIQFNFNRDYTFSRFLLGSQDITSLYNAESNKIRFTVEESTSFVIEGTSKTYGDLLCTAYVMNPEGLRVALGEYGSVYNRITDIDEGTPITEDITTPDVSFSSVDGSSMSMGNYVLTPENARSFSLTVSERNPYVYMAPMPGYYILAVWNFDMTEILPYATLESNEAHNVIYIIACKIETNYQAEVNLIGNEPLTFSPSQNLASVWNNNVPPTYGLMEGKQLISFDPAFNLPFSVRPLSAFDKFAVYLDGLMLTPDENGIYYMNFYAGESALKDAAEPNFSHLTIYADKSVTSPYGNVKITVHDNKTIESCYGDLNLKTPDNCSMLAGTVVTVRPTAEDTALTLNNELIYGYDSNGLVDKLVDGAYTFTVESGKNYVFVSEEDLNKPTGITVISSQAEPQTKIFNLQGICVGTDWDSLPAGLYIRNGKRTLKR